MRKTINIAGKPVELKATASTLRKYRNWFGRDLIADFKKMQAAFALGDEVEVTGEAIEIVELLTFTMARQADKTIPADIDEWLDQFDSFPIQDFAVDVIMFWAESLQSNSESKNV